MKENTIIGSYRIVSRIGEGGMGEVYLAEHTKLERKVAVKVLDSSLSTKSQFRERFLNEANVLAKLNHPNIVSIYDLVEHEGQYCIVMEYVEGLSLSEKLSRHGALSNEKVLDIILKVLSGLSYAHEKSVVHRDIKPSNIIIDEFGTVKVLDFGIAKMLDANSNLTRTGTRMGSVNYMSPEQVLGKELDLKTDIYSFGVTMYEMLTGILPFDTNTESDFVVQNKIVNESLPDIRTRNPIVSERLAMAIEIATRKNPGDRFSDCSKFISFVSGKAEVSEETVSYSSPAKIDHNKTVVDNSRTVFVENANTGPVDTTVKNIPGKTVKNKSPFLVIILVIAFLVVGIVAFVFLLSDRGSEEKSISEMETVTPKTVRPITSEEVNSFIAKWCTLQSTKNISQYLNCYSSNFMGIKRTNSGKEYTYDFAGWAADRAKMYESAENLSISASNVNVKSGPDASGVYTIEFDQYYYSKKYNDKGKKVMKLKRSEEGDIKITYEELLYSQQIMGN